MRRRQIANTDSLEPPQKLLRFDRKKLADRSEGKESFLDKPAWRAKPISGFGYSQSLLPVASARRGQVATYCILQHGEKQAALSLHEFASIGRREMLCRQDRRAEIPKARLEGG